MSTVRIVSATPCTCCGAPTVNKLLLPILTEATGDWYPSCADAAADMADQVTNCLTYGGSVPLQISRNASVFGALNFDIVSAVPILAYSFWCAMTVQAGNTIGVSTNVGRAAFKIYNNLGVLIQDVPSAPGTAISAPVPYSGKYILRVDSSAVFLGPTDARTSVFAGGTFAFLPPQALYNIGGPLPGRLDCGNSCP